MKHSVAIRAYGTKIFNWIYFILFTNISNLFQVIDLNVVFTYITKCFLEVKSTNTTIITVIFNACLPCNGASIVCSIAYNSFFSFCIKSNFFFRFLDKRKFLITLYSR